FGSLLRLTWTTHPGWLSTGLYLGMGWGSAFCYAEVARRVSGRALLPILVGGVLYSVGAVINLLQQPVFWTGVFEAHALFHLLVLAGSVVHFRFMPTVVIPYEPRAAASVPALDPGLPVAFTTAGMVRSPGRMGG